MNFFYTMLLVSALTIPALGLCLIFDHAVKKIIALIVRTKHND